MAEYRQILGIGLHLSVDSIRTSYDIGFLCSSVYSLGCLALLGVVFKPWPPHTYVSFLQFLLPLVIVPCARLLAEIFGSLLPVLQLHRKDPSRLLVQPSGMTSQLPSAPFLAIPQIHFLEILRPFFLIRPGSGAPLSRDLEGALYKFY